MAMFHFRIKSDKKPDGTKVSAVKHVEYIRREGNFAQVEEWKEKNKFDGFFISSKLTQNLFDGQNFFLYKTDDFGSIRNSENGIEVTENSSPTTLAVALILTDKTMNHQPLVISNAPNFKKSVLEVALLADLDISFADKLLQDAFVSRKENLKNDQKNFIKNGGYLITKRPTPKNIFSPAHTQTVEDVTKVGLNLRSIADLKSIPSLSAEDDISLSEEEKNELEQLAQDSYQNLRFDFSHERKNLAKWTADTILQRLDESFDYISAHSHIEYINRENAFAHRGGCIFHSHHLPKWAKDDPKNFFKAADRYEGSGNRRYVEIEFALPNELKTVEQFRQIIEPFIQKHLANHYYAYAIHDKFGELSNQRHPHVHIMFSERLIDDVERIKERLPCNFFKYPARKKKDGSEPTFEEKFKRGALRDRKWGDHSYITQLRADCAQIQNEVLEKNGFSIRVDHRSLLAQKEEAERNGDSFLAKLFDRIPEKYVGIISCKENDDPKLERLKKFRRLRQQHFDLLLKMDALTKEADELETKDDVQFSSSNAKNFIDSNQFLNSNPDSLQDLKSKISDVSKWKRAIISRKDAELQAKMEYMTKAERKIWQQYQESLAQKKNLEEFLISLKQPDDSQRDALKTYEDVVSGVKSKIFALITSSALLKKSVADIEQKLESPGCKKNILLVAHQILQSNLHARKMLKLANQNLQIAVDNLHGELFAQNPDGKDIFKIREVYNILHRHHSDLKKESDKLLDLKFDLLHKIISPQRATDMAKNIFVHGDFKKLRFDFRQLRKDTQTLDKNLRAFSFRQNLFQDKDWPADEHSIFLQEKYFLTKQKTLLDLEQKRLTNLKISLHNRQVELDSLCDKRESQKQIQFIAASILKKNLKFVRQLEEVEDRRKNLLQQIDHITSQLDSLRSLFSSKRSQHFCFKVLPSDKPYATLPDKSSVSLAALIADAILQEPDAVQLVAYCPDDYLEIDKTWALMSELDKAALIWKKMVREL